MLQSRLRPGARVTGVEVVAKNEGKAMSEDLFVEYTYPSDYRDRSLAGKTVRQPLGLDPATLPGDTVFLYCDPEDRLPPPDLIPDVGYKRIDGLPVNTPRGT